MNPSVLEKCGVTKEIAHFFKKKGLIVPNKMFPVENPIRTPSEEWFYAIADRFTPPLDYNELHLYTAVPYLLSQKIVDSAKLLSDIAMVLHEALDSAIKLEPQERIAAILSILKIFHACLDNNYLKYDRHLECHEYESTPVGHHWKKLRLLIAKSASARNLPNPDQWANEKLLEVISGIRRMTLTGEYSICCNAMYAEIESNLPQIASMPITEVADKLKTTVPSTYSLLSKYAEAFYKTLDALIFDCISAKGLNFYDRMKRKKKQSRSVIIEICSGLDETDSMELERVLEIIDDFAVAQELEGSIIYGLQSGAETHTMDLIIKGFDLLRETLKDSSQPVRGNNKTEILQLLKSEEIPDKFTAIRNILMEINKYFVDDVITIYNEAISKWQRT